MKKDSIDKLKAQRDKARAQRDKIKATRDELRHKLARQQLYSTVVAADHFDLWSKHVAPNFELTTPPRDIISHVCFVRGREVPQSTLRWLHGGYIAMRHFDHVLRAAGCTLPQGAVILDFGCGSARVTRFMSELAPDAQLFGCDIDAAAIDWNVRNLHSSGHYLVSPDEPPLPSAIPLCDLIIAISVFTHLPEPMQNRWLAELRARLKPGGCLCATFHGEACERFIPEAHRGEFEAKGFTYANLGLTEGLPDYYQTAFHSVEYVREHWTEGFTSFHHAPTGNAGQDVAVLVK